MTWLHAAENGAQHAFAAEVAETGARLRDFEKRVWYRVPDTADACRFDAEGMMDLSSESARLLDARTQFWLCGPVGFMQFVAGQLRDAGVDASRIHYEVFGPHKGL